MQRQQLRLDLVTQACFVTEVVKGVNITLDLNLFNQLINRIPYSVDCLSLTYILKDTTVTRSTRITTATLDTLRGDPGTDSSIDINNHK